MNMGTGSSVELGRFITMLMDEGQEAFAPQFSAIQIKDSREESAIRSKVRRMADYFPLLVKERSYL
ncbi:hypothetical protein [Paenibacillus sp. SI8]|uniref:hypothetical protein n=1 Tax=unclassified Paenibacillus TaxID=185978 RepID=UPI0034668D90